MKLLLVWGFVSLFCVTECQREKRQVSFSFGVPNQGFGLQNQGFGLQNHGFGLPNQNNNNPQAAGHAFGQALGNTVNNLLGGLLGGNRPQGCNVNNGGCMQGCQFRRQTGVQCYCNPGYVLQRDRISCVDINECVLGPEKPCQDQCINTPGSFRCACPKGILQADQKSCGPAGGQLQTTCAVNNGGCDQDCKDKNKGGVRCKCSKGYTLADNQKSCLDIDECSSASHNCRPEQLCINAIGSFQCTLGGATTCGADKGGCEHRCVENKHGVRCACRKGFELKKDGRGCRDIDECATGQHTCPEICINHPGKFECTTQTQQLGCSLNNGGCAHRCRDTRKGVKCTCTRGFVLQPDAKSCKETVGQPVEPTDPCEVDNGGCEQICINQEGHVLCQCDEGFRLASGFCQREIVVPPPPPPIIQSTTPSTIPQEGCGVNTKKSIFRTRIVGGKPADPKDWPWMAAILRNAAKTQFCGGTLITDQHVLTAAHCVISFKKEDIFVRLGEYNFDTPDENNPTDFRVEDIKRHLAYDTKTQENDIAIIKLARPSSFSEYIWPACLPPLNDDFMDQMGFVTGWGSIHFGGPVSSTLMEVVVPVWKQSDCVAAYPENKVTDNMMCAGLKTGGKDSCQGDSGGPFLLQFLPTSKWYVAGVVSWGIECASANRPGVYTRVNKYLDWIKENTL